MKLQMCHFKDISTPLSEDIEAPCIKLQGIFDPQGSTIYSNRSLTPQQAAGNALAPGFTMRHEWRGNGPLPLKK